MNYWAAWICRCILVVSSFGSTATADGSVLRVPEDFATIQAAVDAAVDGDRIRIGPGQHCEYQIVIEKRVELFGEGDATICSPYGQHGRELIKIIGPGGTGTAIRHLTVDGGMEA